jgi:hypothetical protein
MVTLVQVYLCREQIFQAVLVVKAFLAKINLNFFSGCDNFSVDLVDLAYVLFFILVKIAVDCMTSEWRFMGGSFT